MDELLEKNRPAQTVQSTPQPTMHERTPPEVHPTKEEWEELIDYLYTLGYHAEKQTGLMKKASELLAQLPTKAQMDELLKAVKHLEQMAEQAGKQKEKRFSLPRISLPSLEFPRLSPALLLIPVVLFVLWTMWYSLDTLWVSVKTVGGLSG
ncbi:hypothetical protein [Intestinimonas timonensis]|uniref:hypothetical protein n=1 Tax=Intestinimonas timonensis TaxID=1689270 RepID=UPI0013EF561E|nr:hypothetical protein [Intestinimonas timonensis]